GHEVGEHDLDDRLAARQGQAAGHADDAVLTDRGGQHLAGETAGQAFRDLECSAVRIEHVLAEHPHGRVAVEHLVQSLVEALRDPHRPHPSRPDSGRASTSPATASTSPRASASIRAKRSDTGAPSRGYQSCSWACRSSSAERVSSPLLCGPSRCVANSTTSGPAPSRVRSTSGRSPSLISSTCREVKCANRQPNARARSPIVPASCAEVGVVCAIPLFSVTTTSGSRHNAAMLSASYTAPSPHVPSPM